MAKPLKKILSPVKGRVINFSVDSALLRELGERLVGQPHIALAELVKNGYDADATEVIIRIRTDSNYIEIIDNGHGMTESEFEHFWMRIGTPHKQADRTSRDFYRPLTGSKGVGRLAVQFLGSTVEVRTVSTESQDTELVAFVNWKEAVNAGELTKATALVNSANPSESFPNNTPHGTSIKIANLDRRWTGADIENLASEIWWLRPPLKTGELSEEEASQAISIKLESESERLIEQFEAQMKAVLQLYHAQIYGKLTRAQKKDGSYVGRVQLSLDYADGTKIEQSYEINDCNLEQVQFVILIYHLQHKQRFGIKVNEAREYLDNHGGVHVYDAGFHLPYYGRRDADWLGIEFDHSRRANESKFLPKELQSPRGLQSLPTIRRILGVVRVDTAKERELGEKENRSNDSILQIQVTRDRLQNNQPYKSLTNTLRWALDFYAHREAERIYREKTVRHSEEPPPAKYRRVEEVLEHHKEAIPAQIYQTITREVKEATVASEAEAEFYEAHAGLLGALATAGMAAMAYEHEFNRQFRDLENIATSLESQSTKKAKETARQIHDWIERVRGIRSMFTYLLHQENRETRQRFKTRAILEQMEEQVRAVMRSTEISIVEIPDSWRFPTARLMDWSAIFQNVLINAYNAMLDSNRKRVRITANEENGRRAILVEDTGCGINLRDSDTLFEPFIRKLRLSEERSALGMGGSGLGLTIVRMVAESLDCKARFVHPSTEYETAFELSWREEN